MAFITYDYACPDCGTRYTAVMRDRKDPDLDKYPCGECGGTCNIAPAINPSVASYPDGVRRHTTTQLRERQALRKAQREARRSGDREGVAKAKQEMSNLKGKT